MTPPPPQLLPVVRPRPKVVILAGPHKAGSTSLQSCMVRWTSNDDDVAGTPKKKAAAAPAAASSFHLDGWAWPLLSHKQYHRSGLKRRRPSKTYAGLMAALNPNDAKVDSLLKDRGVPVDRKVTLQAYRSIMADAWFGHQQQQSESSSNNGNNGKGMNLVFGSEEFDQLVSVASASDTDGDGDAGGAADGTNTANSTPSRSTSTSTSTSSYRSRRMMDGILSILPWMALPNVTTAAGERSSIRPPVQWDDLEVVVVHRAPRVEHLISIWKEMGLRNQSLREFLLADGVGGVGGVGSGGNGDGNSTTANANATTTTTTIASMVVRDNHGHPSQPFAAVAYWADSIGLALLFLERGVRTTVVDMGGLAAAMGESGGGDNGSSNNHHLCRAVACDVMHAEGCDRAMLTANGAISPHQQQQQQQQQAAEWIWASWLSLSSWLSPWAAQPRRRRLSQVDGSMGPETGGDGSNAVVGSSSTAKYTKASSLDAATYASLRAKLEERRRQRREQQQQQAQQADPPQKKAKKNKKQQPPKDFQAKQPGAKQKAKQKAKPQRTARGSGPREGQSSNAKDEPGPRNLSLDQLERIDGVMNEYDCSRKERLLRYLQPPVLRGKLSGSKPSAQGGAAASAPLLRLLYPDHLLLEGCAAWVHEGDNNHDAGTGTDKTTVKSLSWMVGMIQEIAKEGREG